MSPSRPTDASTKPGKLAGTRRKPNGAGDPPRDLFKKTTLCRFHSSRSGCERGTACPFAHGADEMRTKPDLTKTSLCKLWVKGRCPSDSSQCPWAHGRHELQGIRTDTSSELDPNEMAQALAMCPPEAGGHNEDGLALGCGDATKGAANRSKREVTVDILLNALGVGSPVTTSASDDESLCKKPAAQQDVQKECPRCNLGGHSSTARFCVQCGYALVESGAAQSPDGSASVVSIPSAMPVFFGEPGAVMQAPWPMGACAPGTVILMPATPQGWVALPPASFATGDVPVVGVMSGCSP